MFTKKPNNHQFDYCIVIISENDIIQAKILVPFGKNAPEIYSNIIAAVEPLESLYLKPTPCPDYLVERTVSACYSKHKLDRKMDNSYHFAYGSNMSQEQMADRCPRAVFVDTAKLRGYRFIINARGVATIVSDLSREVYGILWKITEDCEESLDVHEGVKWGTYSKTTIDVKKRRGKSVTALIYIANNVNPGSGREGYVEKIIAAAEQRKLPSEYLAELKLWL